MSATVRVRYQETDQMGVVHHSNYFVWFEVGRTAFIRELGMSYRDLEAKGIILPVIEANCQYKSPAHYDDVVQIETTVTELSPVKIRFGYKIIRESDKKLLATGFTLHVWTNREIKPFNLKRKWPDIYELLESQRST